MWKRYVDTVAYAATQRDRTRAVGIRQLAAPLGLTLP
jgi:hypothetical protein